MILQELAALAAREKLVPDSDYEEKPVAFIIYLGPTGQYLQVQRTEGAMVPGRKKPQSLILGIPRRVRKSVDLSPEFVVDKAMYVFGKSFDGDKPDRVKECARAFRGLLTEAAESTRDPALKAVVTFIENLEACTRCLRDCGDDLKPADLFAFHWGEDSPDVRVHDREAVRTWWKGRRAAASGDSPVGQCLVTGHRAPLAALHEKVQNPMPGGGLVPFVSFNLDAFESYGLHGNENAPVSQEASVLYAEALKRLQSDRRRDPRGAGYLPRQYVRLSEGSVAVFWARSENPVLDVLAPALEGLGDATVDPASFFDDRRDPRVLSALFSSPHKGTEINLEDPAAFFAAILSGAQGRISLRSWLVTTVREAVRNLKTYFEDLRLEPRAPLPWVRLLGCLAPLRKLERLPAHLSYELFEAALFGRPFARSLLEAAVGRNRVEKGVTPERASLIKAVLARDLRRQDAMIRRLFPDLKEVTVSMDLNNRTAPYALGRLLAILDRMQSLALGNVDAGIVERYYGSASSTPQTVFPRLMRGYVHHKKKAMESKPGAAVNTDKLLADALAPFRPSGGSELRGFPIRLSLEEQGLFALGFHHQRADFYRRTETEETN